ncbi:MAG: LysE family translocator [Deltaproteobacteria bacterium]
MSFDILLFLKGFIAGIVIATPVGPVAALCVQRTLIEGKIYGLISGLGAAAADAACGVIVVYGFSFIVDAAAQYEPWFRIAGGLALIYIGARIFISNPIDGAAAARNGGAWSGFLSAFALTLTNPLTAVSLAVILTGLGALEDEPSYVSSMIVASGVFTGSAVLWFALCSLIFLFREKFTRSKFIWLNRITGSAILIFGLFALSGWVALSG